jgi:iron(II)-dependent oxidoreductase
MLTSLALDRAALIDWYRRNRERSAALFDMIEPAAYYSRPISLRNPIVFYEGHLPAFSVLAFLRRGLGRPPVDARLEKLFERGIDPDTEAAAVPRSGASTIWPSRAEVQAFARACDDAMLEGIADVRPTPESIEGLYTALEHEAMHQETLLYMWHRLPYEQKSSGGWRSEVGGRSPGNAAVRAGMPASVVVSAGTHDGSRRSELGPPSPPPHLVGASARSRRSRVAAEAEGRSPGNATARTAASVVVPAGPAVLGAARAEVVFGWDNEFEAHDVHVPAFDVDTLPITNAQFLEFVEAGGYANHALWDDEGWDWITREAVAQPAFWISEPRPTAHGPRTTDHGRRWRGMLEPLPLPLDWPVYVSQAEASAYARWKGRRLMTEAEFHRASEGATAGHADFAGFDPVPVGSHPQTASVHGAHDLIGNGWEWTCTVFGPFDGFTPMPSYPEYSADFFDGRHYVMKGASPATARELIRPSFRNWFRGNYPYVYAKFRTVRA